MAAGVKSPVIGLGVRVRTPSPGVHQHMPAVSGEPPPPMLVAGVFFKAPIGCENLSVLECEGGNYCAE